jgi:hypothetical protein
MRMGLHLLGIHSLLQLVSLIIWRPVLHSNQFTASTSKATKTHSMPSPESADGITALEKIQTTIHTEAISNHNLPTSLFSDAYLFSLLLVGLLCGTDSTLKLFSQLIWR